MYKNQYFSLVIILTVIFSSAFVSGPRGWELLGERKVNRGIDHDEISVGLRDGVFSKLKIKVRHSSINLHRMMIHFADGSHQEANVREDIAKGGESRIIDLKGNKRIIKSVDFWYDTKGGLLNDKAIVQLWGRK